MKPWGLLAQFDSAEALLVAARAVHAAGCRQAEAYAPFDVEGLDEALGLPPSRIPAATLAGAVLGGAGGYFMQWYAAVIDLPLNIGGRPEHSWPMFIPVTFEMTILGGALAAVLAFFVAARLPALDHPVFGAPGFEQASRDGFFLLLRLDDPAWPRDEAERLLQGLSPRSVAPVQEVMP
ncbi:DUF3341 domain-containing protein [Xylophilus rhododendri]|uniref:DUF3341 domain-containing protein n=1 Tax=Xylophilus rhododendri TaxID=2697032 RepID=A0A857J2D1_9BURK|nr:DUF3341 domain-containing protein [Xylophilus rhododendri]QHI97383.1 DUF3341 domain-containing protein [Xylophilus rhododendri]